MKAKSISFASMGEDEFSKLYQAVLTVVLNKIMVEFERDAVDQMVVNSILEFA